MSSEFNPSCCEACGALVSRHRTLDGARYSIPVSDPALFMTLDRRDDINTFIYDRLRRAEKIITDLRWQLDEKCTNDPSSK